MFNQRVIMLNRFGNITFSRLRPYSASAKKDVQVKTAGIIVIGDEILKGQIEDTNSRFLAKHLYGLGVKVDKVSVVSDCIETISEEVKIFSSKYDFVFTSGGIGPTHDDVTYEAMAKAFDTKLVHHPYLVKQVFGFYKTNDMAHPSLKLAHIPETSVLNFGTDLVTKRRSTYPTISLKNVYVLPGVPQLFEKMLLYLIDIFDTNNRFYNHQLYFDVGEDKITNSLNETVKKYPNVIFGSYPNFFHSYYSVKITFESLSKDDVDASVCFLKKIVPLSYQVKFDDYPYSDKKTKFMSIEDGLSKNVLDTLKNVLQTYGSDNVYLYFDGGKNSTLLIHILSIIYEELFENKKMNVLYVENNVKVSPFIKTAEKNYKMDVFRFRKLNFERFLKSNDNTVLIKGTRFSDPSYKGIVEWLEGLRLKNEIINPFSAWHYSDVWGVIRKLSLPYSKLYDVGYTSIGMADSKPNIHLVTDGPRADITYYKKAYQLEHNHLE